MSPRAARYGFARGVSGAIYGCRGAGLSGVVGWFGAVAVPEVIRDGDSLGGRAGYGGVESAF
jgi:hypothetical protein